MFPAAKRQRMDDASGGSRNPDQAQPHAYVLPHASALPAIGGAPEQSYQIHIGTAPPVPDIRALFEAGRYQEAGLAPMSQLFAPTHMPLPRPTRYHPDPIPYGIMIPDNEEMVNAISPDLLKRMFLQLTQEDASGLMYSALVNHHVRQHVTERTRVINFDSYSRTAWHAINTKYDRLSGSKQYERANDVLNDVERCIESISQQATAFSSFGTKVNALETLRRIGKTIISASEIIGREVHRNYEWDMGLKNAITTILRTMSREECFKAGQNVSEVGKGKLWEKMEWVRAEAVNNHCLAGLDVWEACERLRGEDPDEITDSEFEKEDESEGDDQDEEEDEDEIQEDYERENEGSTGRDDERSNASDEDEEPFHPS
ncbi:hypothetical protein CKM354_000906800 [Cercospora kikuchii]|uniref:Uncharacterized protein n=1 Tax=Cercospora kikuchii TaxID=84275 RepID=A0A9P3CQX4_9PEZI|nr:uncharacterized protein CKM354_000906800 [Cercospora kikuchii]GIZ45922.1 hypothetical protein CKM354_000906800 [Cercospora kikuchii]